MSREFSAALVSSLSGAIGTHNANEVFVALSETGAPSGELVALRAKLDAVERRLASLEAKCASEPKAPAADAPESRGKVIHERSLH